MQSSDQTEVTTHRSAPEDRPLLAHSVVGERYEIREELSTDGLSRSYLAFDQEAEHAVLLRRLAGDLVAPGKSTRAVLEALRPSLGFGGRYLSGLLDADIEDERLYVVQALPRGVPLSAVIRRRAADDRIFGAKEVLPVVAQLAGALASIAPPHAHLEITARQVWLDAEGLMLSGGFLFGALPQPAVARVLGRDSAVALTASPELLTGNAGDAADVFSVGCLAQTLLVPRGESASPLTLGPVAAALEGLLHRDRTKRTTSLDDLVEGLARLGGLPVPELDPGAYRRARPRRRPSEQAPAGEVSQIDPHLLRAAKAADARTELEPEPLRAAEAEVDEAAPELRPRSIPGAASGGTQEISLDQIVEEAPIEELDGLDPRLVRAALDMELHEEPEMKLDEDLEMEPVVAPNIPRESTQEITLDQIVDEVPNRADLDSIDPTLLAAARASKLSAPLLRAKRKAPETEELTLEELTLEPQVPPGVKPLPRPRRPSSPGLVAATPALYDDSRSLPALDASALPQLDVGDRPTPVPERRASRIMLVAVLLGVAILASSIGYAAYRQHRAQRLREDRLEQRYQRLQQEADGQHTEP